MVVEEGADPEKVAQEIVDMPGYFAPYETSINFVTKEELAEICQGFPHDGLVITAGVTGAGNPALAEYRCAWGSNPEATANVLVAHARAAYRLAQEKKSGAFTSLDIPPAHFSSFTKKELLERWM